MTTNYTFSEEDLRKLIEDVGRSAAATCIMAVLTDVIMKAVASPSPTKILVDKGVPAQLYAIGSKDKSSAVYVSTKKNGVNWKPALFFGAIAVGCWYILDYRDKNYANVVRKSES